MKFNKHITDNEWGRYISGGINRIALLSNSTIVVNNDDINDECLQFDDYDCVTSIINYQPVAIIKDFNQQVSLSYHRIDKNNMDSQWNSSNCYCIE